MAFGSANGSGMGSSDGPISAINVTPLVDVMLVLLVIFMVTAPMLQQGVDVNLPKTAAGAMKGKDEQIVVSLNSRGEIFLGADNKFTLPELTAKLKTLMATKAEADRKIYVKADTAIQYGRVMELIGKLNEAGISQIGLVSAPAETQKLK